MYIHPMRSGAKMARPVMTLLTTTAASPPPVLGVTVCAEVLSPPVVVPLAPAELSGVALADELEEGPAVDVADGVSGGAALPGESMVSRTVMPHRRERHAPQISWTLALASAPHKLATASSTSVTSVLLGQMQSEIVVLKPFRLVGTNMISM